MGDQLSRGISALRDVDHTRNVVFMAEVHAETTYVRHHKQKLVLVLSAMRRFAEDEVKLVLTPLPVRDSDLEIFRYIATACRGNITVYPIRMQQGFNELGIALAAKK